MVHPGLCVGALYEAISAWGTNQGSVWWPTGHLIVSGGTGWGLAAWEPNQAVPQKGSGTGCNRVMCMALWVMC